MSSMQRTIKRSIAKKKGEFTAQKPLRSKDRTPIKEVLLQALRGMSIFNKSLNKKKGEK